MNPGSEGNQLAAVPQPYRLGHLFLPTYYNALHKTGAACNRSRRELSPVRSPRSVLVSMARNEARSRGRACDKNARANSGFIGS